MPMTALYALERRLEVYVAADVNPTTDGPFQAERIVSYDNGETWVDNWVRNKVGTFRSSLAGAMTGDSLDGFLVGRGMDNGCYFTRLQEYYEFTTAGWSRIGSGAFNGKPALCLHGTSKSSWKSLNNIETSYNGIGVRVFGLGMDKRIWWALSTNGGNSWDMAWDAIGAGKFTSSPAAATSADGTLLTVFAKGTDDKIWWAFSHNGASSWDMAWDSIGTGVFTSAPAACCSADGKRIYVFAKGKDNRIWWAFASKGTAQWDMAWEPIGDGVFNAQPSACCSWDGKIIHLFGRGTDNRIWQARSFDFGQTWNIAWRKINNKMFVDLDI